MRRQTRIRIASVVRHIMIDLAMVMCISACAFDEAGARKDARLSEPMPTLAPMLERVLPGVVSVAVSGQLSAEEMLLLRDPEFRRMFGLPKRVQPEEKRFLTQGSGIIIDAASGTIVTTHHLVDGAEEITVTLADKRRLTGRMVGSDAVTDIAVVQVEPDDLVAVPLGNSDALRVGDYVVAIGNPFGLAQTATLGIVSGIAPRNPAESDGPFIQTDAAINPGSSGGALVNARGELVGINDSLIGSIISNSGIGFAIPIIRAKQAVDHLLHHAPPRP